MFAETFFAKWIKQIYIYGMHQQFHIDTISKCMLNVNPLLYRRCWCKAAHINPKFSSISAHIKNWILNQKSLIKSHLLIINWRTEKKKLLALIFCRKVKEKKDLQPKFLKKARSKYHRIHRHAKHTPIRDQNKDCNLLSSKNVGQSFAALTCC